MLFATANHLLVLEVLVRSQSIRVCECLMNQVCLRNMCPLVWKLLSKHALVCLQEPVVRSFHNGGLFMLGDDVCRSGRLSLAQFLVGEKHAADPSAFNNRAIIITCANTV